MAAGVPDAERNNQHTLCGMQKRGVLGQSPSWVVGTLTGAPGDVDLVKDGVVAVVQQDRLLPALQPCSMAHNQCIH